MKDRSKFKRKANVNSSKNIMKEKSKFDYNRKYSDEKESIEKSEEREQNNIYDKMSSSGCGNIMTKIIFHWAQF